MQNHPYDKKALSTVVQNLCQPLKNDCVLWKGENSQFGTPTLRVMGRLMDAIKVIWWLKHGYKPWWRHMEQKCSTPHCMNPLHFRDKTPLDHRKKDLVNPDFWKTTFTPKEDATLWERNQNGETMAVLAKEFKVNPMTVCKAIKRHRKTLGQTVIDRQTVPKLWERFILGETIREIAAETNLNPKRLQKAISSYNKKLQDS